MHDTLNYMKHAPLYRKYHHNELTFRRLYAFTENFCLSLSHDEVVHGKNSLLHRMPGDDWQKFANLRLLFGYMYGQPGKKLLFMGSEVGQRNEWYHEQSLDWHLVAYAPHAGVQKWVEDLNRVYRDEPALHQLDFDPSGFEWIDCSDADASLLSFVRKTASGSEIVLVVCNFTPVVHRNYLIGVPRGGFWGEILNSDAQHYGGSGQGNLGGVEAAPIPAHGRPWSLTLTLPPLSVSFFKSRG
jgi:1,4-alpha-glucan branching enzyme